MRKLIILALTALSMAANAAAQKITVVYPPEGTQIPSSTATFIFGNIVPADGKLTINGEAIKTASNGAFIAYLPIHDGDFKFNAELTAGTMTATAVRAIKVGEVDRLAQTGNDIDEDATYPSQDLTLRADDVLTVSAHAAPGMKAFFTVYDIAYDVPMLETSPGHYTGNYAIHAGQKCDREKIRISLYGWTKHDTVAKGRLTVRDDSYDVAVATGDFVPLRSAPSGDFIIFAQEGTPVLVSGQQDGKTRIRLSEGRDVWVDSAKLLPQPKTAKQPSNTIWGIKTVATATSTYVRISGTVQPLYSIEDNGSELNIDFFYSRTHVDTIVYDPEDTFIRAITFSQQDGQTARVTIKLDPRVMLWGYDPVYADGALTIELRRPPLPDKRKNAPLTGLKIAVDPGHSTHPYPPFDGAVGPMGSYEPGVTLLMAKQLTPLLTRLGAQVTQTRQGDEEVKLASRPKLAWSNRCDLYISLHYNAIPDGENPFAKPKGFSVYYTQPHSVELARAIHDSYRKNMTGLGLADESYRYKDLNVTRLTQMPAALVELAHLIMPEQEALANDMLFQKRASLAIAEGVLNYFKAEVPPWMAEMKEEIRDQMSSKTSAQKNAEAKAARKEKKERIEAAAAESAESSALAAIAKPAKKAKVHAEAVATSTHAANAGDVEKSTGTKTAKPEHAVEKSTAAKSAAEPAVEKSTTTAAPAKPHRKKAEAAKPAESTSASGATPAKDIKKDTPVTKQAEATPTPVTPAKEAKQDKPAVKKEEKPAADTKAPDAPPAK